MGDYYVLDIHAWLLSKLSYLRVAMQNYAIAIWVHHYIKHVLVHFIPMNSFC